MIFGEPTAKRIQSVVQQNERTSDYVDAKSKDVPAKRNLWLRITGIEPAPWDAAKNVYIVDVYVGLYDELPLHEDAKMINSLETAQENSTIRLEVDFVVKAVDFVNKDDEWYYVCTCGGSESIGEFQWQQSTMVSSNQRGWEFNRLHGLLNNS